MKKFIPVSIFYFRQNWRMLTLILLGFCIVFFYTKGGNEVPERFTTFFDPLFSVLGLLLTVGLTVFYVYNEWVDQLDRILIVHFKDLSGNYVASCYDVNILPNAELRGLAQQVGAQVLERERNLKINPSAKLLKTDILKVNTYDNNSKWIKYYEIQIRLLENIFKEDEIPCYRVWNMGEDNEIKKKVKISEKVFHEFSEVEYGVSLIDLLNSDKNSMDKFRQINEFTEPIVPVTGSQNV